MKQPGPVVGLLAIACAAAYGQPALVTVGRAAADPEVDGVLDDAAWQTAAEVTGFVLNTEAAFAREQTWVRLCHDDQALYVGFRCAESKLIAASQQSHLFLARLTGRDANVFSEDCVEVFIGPPGTETYYQFAANAAGGTYESRGMDAKWNGEWACAAKVGEGEWVVEMALPFAALGASATTPGEWRLNLCREGKPGKEISTWSGLEGAFHNASQFGRMVLGEAPAIRIGGLPGPDRPLRVAAEGLTTPLKVRLIARDGGTEASAIEALASGARSEATVAVPRVPGGARKPRVRWEVTTQSGETLARSAWVEVGGSARDITLVVMPHHVTVVVLLNGQPVPVGEGGRCLLTLSEGANVIGLDCRAGRGTWSLGVAAETDGERRSVIEGWRASGDPATGWAAGEFDASSWPEATVFGGGLVPPEGAAGAVFRRTVYLPSRRETFWPLQTDLYLPRNSRQRLYPLLGESGVHTLAGFTYMLDLPAPLRVEASDRSHGDPVRVQALAPVRRRGRRYNRYAVTGDGPLGSGFQVLAHWRVAGAAQHQYQPVLDLGGTFDWQLLQATVIAPKWATECGVLLLKWQNQGITGEMWFDEVTMRAEGEPANLASEGTFSEPKWEGKSFIDSCDREGKADKCVHFVATPELVDQQQGVWVTEPHVRVTAGKRYTFTVWARAKGVRAPGRQPRACLLVNAGAPAPGELTGYCHWEAQDGNTTEVERAFPIHVLSELPGKRPRETRFIACYYGDLLENEACNEALAETTAASGVNCLYGSAGTAVSRSWPGETPPECIWPVAWEGYDAGPVPGFLRDHPEAVALQKDGKASARELCPTHVLDEPNDFLGPFSRWLSAAVTGSGCRHIDWDHEFPVWRDDSICFDERCLKAFRQWADLPEGAVPTRETVIASHEEEWIRFRCAQNARMAALLRDTVKAVDPALIYSVYSGFQNAFTHETYGVDWGMMAPCLDMGIAGYSGNRETIGDTVAALGRVPFIAGEMYHENDRTAQHALPRPRAWRLRLLRALLNGGGNGVLVWWLPVLDGGGFWGLSEVASLAADFEPFFTEFDRRHGLVTARPALPAGDLTVLVRGDERLLICANGGTEKVEVRLTNWQLPPGAVVREWRGTSTERDARSIRATLGPEEVKVWWIGPEGGHRPLRPER